MSYAVAAWTSRVRIGHFKGQKPLADERSWRLGTLSVQRGPYWVGRSAGSSAIATGSRAAPHRSASSASAVSEGAK